MSKKTLKKNQKLPLIDPSRSEPSVSANDVLPAKTDPRIQELRLLSWQLDVVNADDLSAWADCVQYLGFDPDMIMRILLAREKDVNALKTEISQVLTIYLQRGANIKKIGLKMAETYRDRFNALVTKYSIRASVGRDGSNQVITLPRISACFPLLTMSIFAKVPNLRVIGDTHHVPKHWCFPAAAALLGSVDPTDQFYQRWIAWAESFADVIGGDSSNETVSNYAQIAFRQSKVPLKHRSPTSSECVPLLKLRDVDKDAESKSHA